MFLLTIWTAAKGPIAAYVPDRRARAETTSRNMDPELPQEERL
jgi:hypothetical protein